MRHRMESKKMIPKECKRLAEVDFPIADVNEACVRENNKKTRVDSGHISLLHTWWARRPLASCRAILLGILLPDPTDKHCPMAFKAEARRILSQFGKIGQNDMDLQKALLKFIAEMSDWNLIEKSVYVSASRKLINAAWNETPHVFDPFAGGGSIPLEGLRLGCEVTAAELNPVAWLLLKVTLEWSVRKGPELVELFEIWAAWILKESERRLLPYYPNDEQKRQPLAYLWARTVRCEAPGCDVTIPLIRNLRLSEATGRQKALRIRYNNGATIPTIEVFEPHRGEEVGRGTVKRFMATCPRCSSPMARERVQAQLREKRGGADDAILIAVVRQNSDSRGKDYYAPAHKDLEAIEKAQTEARSIPFKCCLFPAGDTRAFPPHPYGIINWANVFAPRQKLSRWIVHEIIEEAIQQAAKEIKDKELLTALTACLYAAYSDNTQYHTSLCVWLSEGVKSIFIQGSGVPMRADFVEGNPLSPNCEGLAYSIRSVSSALKGLIAVRHVPSSPLLANALNVILPEESVDIVFTDPPYANQIPYAHLSDFFFGWLKLGFERRLPQAFGRMETEKALELTENRAVSDGGGVHDRQWYEKRMKEAFQQMKQTIKEDGVASIVFAHKETDRWEALVSALISAGWCVTSSWPISTERKQRMRGQGYASLKTSVHLICRPRSQDAPVGDWGEVLRELPNRIGDWMERLSGEGIRGADLVFACIGPALELFSKYSKVVDANDREIPLGGDPEASEPHRRGFLSYVWEVVGRTALGQILGTTEARARNSAAGALEEDARLTALFLWTLQSTEAETANNNTGGAEDGEESNEADEEEDSGSKRKKGGYSLIFDVVRRFAQPLGIHLPEWEGRIIETEKGVVRLLAVKERARQLFGEDGASAIAEQIEKGSDSPQLILFPSKKEADVVPNIRGKGPRKKGGKVSDEELHKSKEATTLDRVHAAMLFQAGGRANALRAFLKAEQQRGPDFLRLANALSALYSKNSEEKRLLDAMLLAVPRA